MGRSKFCKPRRECRIAIAPNRTRDTDRTKTVRLNFGDLHNAIAIAPGDYVIKTAGVRISKQCRCIDFRFDVTKTEVAFEVPAVVEISSEIDPAIGSLGLLINRRNFAWAEEALDITRDCIAWNRVEWILPGSTIHTIVETLWRLASCRDLIKLLIADTSEILSEEIIAPKVPRPTAVNRRWRVPALEIVAEWSEIVRVLRKFVDINAARNRKLLSRQARIEAARSKARPGRRKRPRALETARPFTPRSTTSTASPRRRQVAPGAKVRVSRCAVTI